MRRLDRIVIECTYAKRLAAFWAAVTGYQPGTVTESGIALLEPPDGGGPSLYFVTGREPAPVDRSLTLQFVAEDLEADLAVLQNLGATIVQRTSDRGVRGAVLADPEGNEFRVVAAAADG